MTTAHRPTWAPAKGGEEQGGQRIFAPSRQVSAKDAPGFTKLKFRQVGQAAASELDQKDLKADLAARERQHFLKKRPAEEDFEEARKKDLQLLEAPPGDGGGGGARARPLVPRKEDADDEDEEDESSDDSDDDEDEEAELLAELERIKKERAEEAARQAAEDAKRQATEQEQEALRGNPLLNQVVTFEVKKRWDDDVVFRNQARGEPKAVKRFINDTIRSDFHRRFLNRYVK